MANPQNTDNLYQNPQPSQWVNRQGDTRDASSILGATVRSGSLFGTLEVGVTATSLRVGVSDLALRHTLIVHNDSANDIFVGFDNTVTTSNGLPIVAGDERSFFLDPNDGLELFGISGIASTVRVFEIK